MTGQGQHGGCCSGGGCCGCNKKGCRFTCIALAIVAVLALIKWLV